MSEARPYFTCEHSNARGQAAHFIDGHIFELLPDVVLKAHVCKCTFHGCAALRILALRRIRYDARDRRGILRGGRGERAYASAITTAR
jgi:hypothetical protein